MSNLLSPPLYILIYAGALVVLTSVIALLWYSRMPDAVQHGLIGLNAVVWLRVAVLFCKVMVNRARGGY